MLGDGNPARRDDRVIRVFISSTFRDMHAERDVLVTVVFPELRERLERLGLEFFDVDLRWGVPETGVDGERANSWAYCKQWIERVEPFFVCMLGERYGWVPPPSEIRDPADRARYEGLSITDMEVRHAVLSGDNRRRSYFYFRETRVPREGPSAGAYQKHVDLDGQPRLDELKAAIRELSNRPVRNYSCRWTGEGFADLDQFGETVLEDLWSGVLRDDRYVSKAVWRTVLGHEPDEDPIYTSDATPLPRDFWERIVELAKPIPPDPLDAEAEEMAAFAAGRLRWFQGREREIQRVRAFIEDSDSERHGGICVVRAAAGTGKSALLAKIGADLASSAHLVIAHFVGATERSADVRSLLERLVAELHRHAIPHPGKEDPKQDLESLRARFASRLEAYSGARRIVLLIDGVNQFTDGHDLSWLPDRMGDGVRIVLSTVDDPAAPIDSAQARVIAALERRLPSPSWVPLRVLDEPDVREIVDAFLREYCKELDQSAKDTIARMDQARNPLYLVVLLHELRTLGGEGIHLKVRGIIDELPKRHLDTVSLFDWMLERLEVFGEETARRWWIFLSLGRVGMSGLELRDLLGRALGADDARAATRLERGIRRYLQRRGAQWDFFHGQLRDAVVRRYGPVDPVPYHAEVAGYLYTRWRGGDRHVLSELPYHQTRGERWDALDALLCDCDFIAAKCAAGMTYALVADYNAALAALPEGREEWEKVLDERGARYAQELIDYADKWSKARDEHERDPLKCPLNDASAIPLPEPPPTVRMWTNQESETEVERIRVSQGRMDRLRAFGQFVAADSHLFVRFSAQSGFCLQQAYNSASNGPVAQVAEARVSANRHEDAATLLLLAPAQRPAWNPRPQCERVLTGGHTGHVNAAVLTFDGRRAISGGTDGIRLWDVTTGESQFVRFGSGILALVTTSDGRRAISTHFDQAIRVWDPAVGICARELTTYIEMPIAVEKELLSTRAAAVTPDGRLFVSGSGSRTLVWNLSTLACEQTLHGGDDFDDVGALALTPDGRRAVSGGRDPALKVWNLTTGAREQSLKGHTKPVNAVALTPDGARAVSGGDDGTLRAWSLVTNACEWTLTGHSGAIESVAISADGSRAVSGGADSTLRVWNLATGTCEQVLRGHSGEIRAVSLTPDGRRALSAGTDSTLRVWNLTAGTLDAAAVEPGYRDEVTVSLGARHAVSSGKHIRVWDLKTGQEVVRGSCADGAHVNLIALAPGRGLAVAACSDETLQVWNLENGTCERSLEKHTDGITTITTTSDGTRAVSGSADGALRCWNLAVGLCESVLTDRPKSRRQRLRREGRVEILVLTPDGRRAISVRRPIEWVDARMFLPDGRPWFEGERAREVQRRLTPSTWDSEKVCVWDLARGVCEQELVGHAGGVRQIAVTPDGRRAISAGDQSLRVWDLMSGVCEREFVGSAAFEVVVTPDGSRAVSAGHDKCLRVWELATGVCRQTIEADVFGGLAITPDGECAVSQSADETFRIWDLATGVCRSIVPGHSKAAISPTAVILSHYQKIEVRHAAPSLIRTTPSVTPTRLWRYDDTPRTRRNPVSWVRQLLARKSGYWDNHLTIACVWCGHRFPDAPGFHGADVHCPAPGCGQPLRLTPFVCDPTTWKTS